MFCRNIICSLLKLFSSKRGILLTTACFVVFMILFQNHRINDHIRASYLEKESAGQIFARKMDLQEVGNNVKQVAAPGDLKVQQNVSDEADDGVTDAENNPGQEKPGLNEQNIVKHSKVLQTMSDEQSNPGHIAPSTEAEKKEDLKALQNMTDKQRNRRQVVPEDNKVKTLMALYNVLTGYENVKIGKSNLKPETEMAAQKTLTVSKPCLSQVEYQRQLTPDKDREKRLAARAYAAPSKHPILPDNHWKLCEPREHTFNYRISQADFCTKHQPTTIILILSSPYITTRRIPLRARWAKWMTYKDHAVACVFLFGQLAGEDQEYLLRKQKILYKENQRYGDIVQADFVDSYANLTYKTLMGLDWVLRFCPQAKYVFKLDDDVTEGLQIRFVNFVQSYSYRTSSAIWCLGRRNVADEVTRDPKSKWCVTFTQYPDRRYPDYCPGGAPGGYGMETSTAERLLTSAYDTRFFWLEDVYITGILRKRLGNVTIYQAP